MNRSNDTRGETKDLTWRNCYIDSIKSVVNPLWKFPKDLLRRLTKREHSSSQISKPASLEEPERPSHKVLELAESVAQFIIGYKKREHEPFQIFESIFEQGEYFIFNVAFILLAFFLGLPFFLFPFLVSAWIKYISVEVGRPQDYGKCLNLAIKAASIGFFFGAICLIIFALAFPTWLTLPIIPEVVLYEVALYISLATQLRYVAVDAFGGLPLVGWDRCIVSATKSSMVGFALNLIWAVPVSILYFVSPNNFFAYTDSFLTLYKLVFLLLIRFFIFGAASIKYSIKEIVGASKILKGN